MADGTPSITELPLEKPEGPLLQEVWNILNPLSFQADEVSGLSGDEEDNNNRRNLKRAAKTEGRQLIMKVQLYFQIKSSSSSNSLQATLLEILW